MKFTQFKPLLILILTILVSLGLVNFCFASQGNPKIYYVEGKNTIYVERTQTQTETIVNLRDIATAINNGNLLKEETSKAWLLKANLFIKKGVKLLLTDETVTWLKLESNPNYFVWLKTYNGDILIQNSKITSWDSNSENFDTDYTSRAFILAKYQARMDILNSELSYLGSSAGESYGVAWRDPNTQEVTGNVQDSTFSYNYYGAYTYMARDMKFLNNSFHHNIQYGLDPHDDSNNFLVEGNTFYENGNHGLIFSKRCVNNTIRNNVSRNNKLTGIMLDKQSDNNTVENNTAYGNVNGIALYGSNNNVISDNTVYQNQVGILLKDQAASNTIESNQIYKNTKYGIYLYKEATGNKILANEIYSNTETGVYIKSSGNTVGPNNNINNNKNGVYLVGASDSTIVNNIINSNTRYGAFLYSGSNRNILNSNTFESNQRSVYIKLSNDNNISRNSIKLSTEYPVYLYDAQNNIFTGNTLSDNTYNYYYLKYRAKNTIKDTDLMAIKIADNESSMKILDTRNYILKNSKNIAIVAEPTQSSILFTRAVSSAIVTFERLNFKVVPSSNQIKVTPQIWNVSPDYDKKWKESSSMQSITAEHLIGDLKPDISYDILIDGVFWNSYNSNKEGIVEFMYNGGYSSEKVFEVKATP